MPALSYCIVLVHVEEGYSDNDGSRSNLERVAAESDHHGTRSDFLEGMATVQIAI